MDKKKWETPELVILTKGKPEEAVLFGCKLTEEFSGQNGPKSRKCIVSSGPCQVRTVT